MITFADITLLKRLQASSNPMAPESRHQASAEQGL